MENYRNYGALNGRLAPNVPIDTMRYTQVYQATHEGGEYLPFMKRSFISFSYGGKNIEDFSLIAVTPGDRIERDAYASFEDLTSTYDTIQGQFYWGTYFHANSLNLTLATDAITQIELDNFKRWFRAGSIRELILAEHPNRAILARVANPPQLSLLPFEDEARVAFQTGTEESNLIYYDTSTTVYRGEIKLEFVMDEPFWYAKQNILGHQNTLDGYYEESWIDANGRLTTIKDSKDALKIVYEDHIPLGSKTKIDVFLGGDIYASVKYEVWARIAKQISASEYETAQNDETATAQFKSAYVAVEEYGQVEDEETGEISNELITNYYKGATIAYQDGSVWLGGKIGGAELLGSSAPVKGITLPYNEHANLYYAGTAPAPVTLRFTLTPQIVQQDITGQGKAYYIVTPKNKHSEDVQYNTITLQSSEIHEFKFTLPTFWLSYNQVIEIFDNESIIAPGLAWLTVRETIRNTVRHPVVRAWANMIINKYDSIGGTGIIGDATTLPAIRGDLERGMQMLLLDKNNEPFPAVFTFDGKTGLAIGKFTYRNLENITIAPYDSAGENESLETQIAHSAYDTSETDDYTELKENYAVSQEENVGDMVRSSYLILDERNILDGNYQVQAWEENHPDYAYLITHDIANGLQDLHFEFKNMYL